MFYPLLSGACLYFCAFICLSFFTASLGSSIAMALEPSKSPSLSLHQAIKYTLAHSPQLHQFTIKTHAILARRSNSKLKPALNVGIELENFAGSGALSSVQSAETTLALSSVIELGGKRRARTVLADTQHTLFEQRLKAFTLDVLGELSATFVQILEVQERVSLAKEALTLTERTLSIVQSRSQQGATPESEVKRASASLYKAKLHVNALEQHHQRLLIKLAAYWGETAPSWNHLAGDIYQFAPASDFSSLYKRALSSPAIALFASEARLKKAEVSLAKTQSKSDISWQLGVRQFEETNDTAFTAGVSLPLFSGRRNRASLKAAMAEKNEVVYQRETARLKLHVQLYEAYSQRKQHIGAMKTYRSHILPNLETALSTTQRAYENGRYSYQDWIAAQKELLEAKSALIDNASAAALNHALIEQLIAEPLYSPESKK